jgi:glycosyltransferase involved in cell wall biosynthesis
VSVIIATYNRAYIVREAIDSIIHQTYKHTEIIIVDDGSTDDTQETLKNYGDQIRVIYQENSGPAAAWNTGIRASHGDIICFLGSDDIYLPTFVERHVSALEKAGPDVPCSLGNGRLHLCNSSSETSSFEYALLRTPLDEGLWLNALDVLATRFVMCGQMIAIRREVLFRIGLFDASLRYLEDYDIALRLALEGPWAFIRDPIVVYRQSISDSISLSISAKEARLHEYLLRIRTRAGDLMAVHGTAVRSRYINSAIRKAKRDLWTAQWAAKPSFLAMCLGGAYRLVEHYRLALYSRSPFYPQMKVAPFRKNSAGTDASQALKASAPPAAPA